MCPQDLSCLFSCVCFDLLLVSGGTRKVVPESSRWAVFTIQGPHSFEVGTEQLGKRRLATPMITSQVTAFPCLLICFAVGFASARMPDALRSCVAKYVAHAQLGACPRNSNMYITIVSFVFVVYACGFFAAWECRKHYLTEQFLATWEAYDSW